jgi:hypothetical protein
MIVKLVDENNSIASTVTSKETLADFVADLRADLKTNENKWENPTIGRYLEAMEAWIRDMDGYYKNTGQQIPEHPNWRTLAEILYAAKIYE